MRPIALLAGFGAAVRTRRTERGLTQAQVAEAAGIAVETVSRLEGGRLATLSRALAPQRRAPHRGPTHLRRRRQARSGAARPAESALRARFRDREAQAAQTP